jgi:hypothetical protein
MEGAGKTRADIAHDLSFLHEHMKQVVQASPYSRKLRNILSSSVIAKIKHSCTKVTLCHMRISSLGMK